MTEGGHLHQRHPHHSDEPGALLGLAQPHGLPGVAPSASWIGEVGVVASCGLVIGTAPVLPGFIAWLFWRAFNLDRQKKRSPLVRGVSLVRPLHSILVSCSCLCGDDHNLFKVHFGGGG